MESDLKSEIGMRNVERMIWGFESLAAKFEKRIAEERKLVAQSSK